MKIAIIGPTYPYRGGISHYTTILVDKLRKKHEVLFLSYKKQYPDFLYPGRTQIDSSDWTITTESIPMVSFTNPWSWYKAYRAVREFDADLLIFAWVSAANALQFRVISGLVARNGNTKVAFLCHNVVQHEKRRIDSYLTKFAFKRGDSFIVHSEGDQAALIGLMPEVDVLHLFLPTIDIFNRGRISPEEAKSRLGFEGEVLLFFGFIREYKGLKYLIEALPQILDNLPKAHLLVVGEFWEDRTIYEKEIEALGVSDSVTIIDRYVPNEEAELYFAAADLLVLPYVSATSSGIIQIGYGFNRPVVTTRVGGLPEVVEDGETGYLVSPRQSAPIAEAVVRCFKEGGPERFSENIERFRKRFSWERLVEAIEDSFEKGPKKTMVKAGAVSKER